MASAVKSTINERRSVKYHENVWDPELVFSLTSPYSAEKYVKEAESLAAEIKETVQTHLEQDMLHTDLIDRLQLVNTLQSLGLHKYFIHLIKNSLAYVHRFWDDSNGIGSGSRNAEEHPNLLCTALAFKLLRRNFYPVQESAIASFRGVDSCWGIKTQDPSGSIDDTEARRMLNLYHASGIPFPEDTILDVAHNFSTQFLNNWLNHSGKQENDEDFLTKEVKYALDFPWVISLPLWESRHYIDIYQSNSDWLRPSVNQKILKLAKLDFNVKQALYQQEIKEIMRWWSREDIPKLDYMRHCPIEFYFNGVLNACEPEFGNARIAYAKCMYLGTGMDDAFDNFATLSEATQFYEMLQRWDPPFAEMGSLPEELRVLLKSIIKGVDEIIQEASKIQGFDMAPSIKDSWLEVTRGSLQDCIWNNNKLAPSFEEYLKEKNMVSGTRLLCLCSLPFVVPNFDVNIFSTPIYFMVDILFRLADDMVDFQKHENPKEGYTANIINCYMVHNPGASLEDAYAYVKDRLHRACKDLNVWYFTADRDDEFPLTCKSFAYNYGKTCKFYVDFVEPHKNFKEEMKKFLLLPA